MLRATCTRARAGWTPELELEVLCEYWTLLAARLPATSFSFGKYDPKAVQNKLLKLRGRLKPMVYQLPYYANEDAFKRILASCKCACATSPASSATQKGVTGGPSPNGTPDPTDQPPLALSVEQLQACTPLGSGYLSPHLLLPPTI